jgi:hypothetical protein
MQELNVAEVKDLDGRESEDSRAQRDRQPAKTGPIEHECHGRKVQSEAGNDPELKSGFAVEAHHPEGDVEYGGTEMIIGVSHNVLVRIEEPGRPESALLAGNVLIRMLQEVIIEPRIVEVSREPGQVRAYDGQHGITKEENEYGQVNEISRRISLN